MIGVQWHPEALNKVYAVHNKILKHLSMQLNFTVNIFCDTIFRGGDIYGFKRQ